MTDYSKLSDFEINFRVAEALNKFEYVSDHNAEGGSAVLCDSLRDCDTYDYCNDPSDAWQVIVQNNICIDLKEKCTPIAYVRGHEPCDDKNPLRAAMICYLMTQEAK